MDLRLLRKTSNVSIYLDAKNDWLFVDWHGELTLAAAQAGYLTVAHCFLTRSYARVLNSNADVTSICPKALRWLAREQLAHLGLSGIEYLAWVCAPGLLLRLRLDEAVHALRAPKVVVFDHLAEAYAWLQQVPRSQLRDLSPLRTPAQQAALAWRTARLAVELRSAGHPLVPGLKLDLKLLSFFLPPAVFSSLRPPADPIRINVQSTVEVYYWCQTLNCTETRLRNALHAVGPLAADVRAYLSR